ncbi:hypothetical protein [Aureibacter tunicatorum]|uniref:Uncharacterized protein n=1 Tax=Aureibacter tunicatorum TaxID=866807 RepID=A0AAE3XT32_9BACT|nr:hypothetical protein [Aureibacter tunicatorum]MDR6241514.1 hypothetical protein [Aureibacter tunicatorum]BDD07028.1 hypothetical protein AUTU_45110 [Aureibacter tunicatorum]
MLFDHLRYRNKTSSSQKIKRVNSKSTSSTSYRMPPIQRYVYSGSDSKTPLQNIDELPLAIKQELEDYPDKERQDLTKALEDAISDPDTPVRIHEDFNLEDIKVQLLTPRKSAITIANAYRTSDIIVATQKARKIIEPEIQNVLRDGTPVFIEDVMRYLGIHEGKLSITDKRPEERNPFDYFGIWLQKNMPELPADHTPSQLNLWTRLARGKAMHYFTRIAKTPIYIQFMLEYMDEAQLMREDIRETDHLDPAYYDLLTIYDHFLTYLGLKPYEGAAILLDNLNLVRHGEYVHQPWRVNSLLWRHHLQRIYLADTNSRPSVIAGIREARPSALEQAIELPAGYSLEGGASNTIPDDFDMLTRGELKSIAFDPSAYDEILTIDEFQAKMKKESMANFHIRRMLVPELVMIEARLQEYEIVKQKSALLQTEMRQLQELDKKSHLYKFNIDRIRAADLRSCHCRMELLDEIEHNIYLWHSRCPVLSMSIPPAFHKSLFMLLETLHKEHVDLIGYMLEQGHPLWVPDQAGLTEEEHEHIQMTWQKLAKDPSKELFTIISNLMFSESTRLPDAAQFFQMVMSSFARLLSRPFGRKLVCDIVNNSQHRLRVFPVPYYDKESTNCVHPTGWRSNTATAKSDFDKDNLFGEVNPSPKHGGNIELKYPDFELQGQMGTHWSVVKRPYRARRQDSPVPKSKEEKTDAVDLLKAQNHYIPNSGNIILKPTFVVLGHEGGHVKNFQEGTNRHHVHKDHYETDPELILWRNNEEHYVITQVENPIREEHHLPPRQWHISQSILFTEFISHAEGFKKYRKVLS